MTGKIVSIVVPCYNVEPYLNRCLDSFLNPEVLEEIEVLIIDDGSTDRTAEIAEKYCIRYPDTFRLFRKENGGHGSGINYGISRATGIYFKVVDGDDWVVTEHLPEFLSVLRRQPADIVVSAYSLVEDQTGKRIENRNACLKPEHEGKCCTFSEAVAEPVVRLHAMTIRTSVLAENHIRVDEKVFYEDAEYILYPVPYVNSFYYHNTILYQYRIGRSGQSVDITSMKKRRKEHELVLASLLSYYKAHFRRMRNEQRRYMEKGIAFVVENQFQIYLALGKQKGIYEEMESFDRNLKKEYPGVYQAVSRKSIWMLRHSGYRLFYAGSLFYTWMKGKR